MMRTAAIGVGTYPAELVDWRISLWEKRLRISLLNSITVPNARQPRRLALTVLVYTRRTTPATTAIDAGWELQILLDRPRFMVAPIYRNPIALSRTGRRTAYFPPRATKAWARPRNLRQCHLRSAGPGLGSPIVPEAIRVKRGWRSPQLKAADCQPLHGRMPVGPCVGCARLSAIPPSTRRWRAPFWPGAWTRTVRHLDSS